MCVCMSEQVGCVCVCVCVCVHARACVGVSDQVSVSQWCISMNSVLSRGG